MDEDTLIKIETENPEFVEKLLSQFIRKNNDVFSFAFEKNNNSRERLWSALFSYLMKEEIICNSQCLSAIRILSRDKSELETLMTEDRIEVLIKCARLVKGYEHLGCNSTDAVEALKCLCNIIYNINRVPDSINKFQLLEAILEFLSADKSKEVSLDLKIFYIKLIFLMTTLSVTYRLKMYAELDGLNILTYLLEDIWNEARKDQSEDGNSGTTLNESQMKLCCEILKTLFNVLLSHKDEEYNEKNVNCTFVLSNTLRNLLLCNPLLPNSKWLHNLHSDVINLLTVMPEDNYKNLIIPEYSVISATVNAESPAMEAVGNIVIFLDHMLTLVEAGKVTSDLISPVLVTLLNLSKSSSIFRKYLRRKVLPNLQEVFKRPEEGDALRNKLCRLLTSHVTSVTELAAEWLFVLCKENVGRMVKYTGYGNAAGLFARRGLLGGSIVYSDDSEDSDTEEYLKHKHMINPIVGCRMESHPNPVENMTDEEKEHIAMALVNKIDKLQRGGIIQPCRIGKDGRPEPVEHVTQLQSELPRQNRQFQFHNDGE